MLLSVATADVPQRAAHQAVTYASLPASSPRKGGDEVQPFAGRETVGEALVALLENADLASAVEEIRIYTSWPRVEIQGANAKDAGYYGYAHHKGAAENGFRTVPCPMVWLLSGGVIQQLALELKEDEDADAGWVGDRA